MDNIFDFMIFYDIAVSVTLSTGRVANVVPVLRQRNRFSFSLILFMRFSSRSRENEFESLVQSFLRWRVAKMLLMLFACVRFAIARSVQQLQFLFVCQWNWKLNRSVVLFLSEMWKKLIKVLMTCQRLVQLRVYSTFFDRVDNVNNLCNFTTASHVKIIKSWKSFCLHLLVNLDAHFQLWWICDAPKKRKTILINAFEGKYCTWLKWFGKVLATIKNVQWILILSLMMTNTKKSFKNCFAFLAFMFFHISGDLE